jgi:hypothetical protein
MQQTGSYGEVFSYDVMQYVASAEGTAFAISGDAEAALSTLLLDGQQYMMRTAPQVSGVPKSTSWDFNAKGRSFTRSPGELNIQYITHWAPVRLC